MVSVYEEEQKFGQGWIWLVLGSIFLISAISWAETSALTLSTGSFFALILSLLLIVLFALLRLKTKISSSEISISYFPILKRTFQWDQIESVELIDYGFVGGWGIRLTKKYGTVYNTGGSKGMLVKLKNGKRLIIGTQNEGEMNKYLQQLKKI